MNTITLINPTNMPNIDRVLQGVVGVYTTVFPNRIRGFYLVGSYADDTANAVSDIDMYVLFKGQFSEGEEAAARQLRYYCWSMSPLRLDLPPVCEDQLGQRGAVPIKLASQLIYGEDIRKEITLPSIEEEIRGKADVPLIFMPALHRVQSVTYPLKYPNQTDEFFGYIRNNDNTPRGIAPDAQDVGTKYLVLTVMWAATAIVLMKAKQYVSQKSDCLRLYETHINDGWTPYLKALYQHCKTRWHYQVPDTTTDRHLLTELCEQTLAFENHYLAIYRDYLQSEIQSNDASRRQVAARQMKIFET